jgi:recA bacterial DNA recombination protein
MSSLIFDVEAAFPFPVMAEPDSAQKKADALLKQLSGAPKLTRVTPASRLEIRPTPETASSGTSAFDALTGGLPRGCLTEICGPDSSGRTSVLLSALAAATRREEVCTLIDASDAFHPQSAAAAGINLERLLWIRCGANAQSSWSRKPRKPASLEEWERQRMEDPVEQALRAADMLLQSSGFGMVAIDLAGVPVRMARRIPLTTWFRFRRTVENTPTILLVIGEQSCAQSCASLSLKLNSRRSSVIGRQRKPVLSSQFSVFSKTPLFSNGDDDDLPHDDNFAAKPSHAELLTGIEIQAEILHSRGERKPVQPASDFESKTAWTA